jgi:hypothetical protein
MHNVFRVAPVAFLTAVSTIGLLQDAATLVDFAGDRPAPVLTQIVWKSTWAGDSKVTEPPKISFDDDSGKFDDLPEILFSVCKEMLSPGNEMAARANQYGQIYRHSYTPASVAAFIAFLKTRISVDWDSVFTELNDMPKSRRLFGENGHDLLWHLELLDAFRHPDLDLLDQIARIPLDSLNPAKIFTIAHRTRASFLVLTIPRSKLTAIYDKVFRRHIPATCAFEIRYKRSVEPNYVRFSTLLPAFGKLVVNEDELTGRIESDELHWHGKSDLHICISLGTEKLCPPICKRPDTRVTFAMYRDHKTVDTFDVDYGSQLEIFGTLISDTRHVHIFKSIEGFEQFFP